MCWPKLIRKHTCMNLHQKNIMADIVGIIRTRPELINILPPSPFHHNLLLHTTTHVYVTGVNIWQRPPPVITDVNPLASPEAITHYHLTLSTQTQTEPHEYHRNTM